MTLGAPVMPPGLCGRLLTGVFVLFGAIPFGGSGVLCATSFRGCSCTACCCAGGVCSRVPSRVHARPSSTLCTLCIQDKTLHNPPATVVDTPVPTGCNLPHVYRVSVLCAALYAKYPYYLVLHMQSVLTVWYLTCKVSVSFSRYCPGGCVRGVSCAHPWHPCEQGIACLGEVLDMRYFSGADGGKPLAHYEIKV